MGLPSVDAAELVALRDGEPVEVGVTYAHEANVEVRRALLEARLFALALSLPKTMPQAPAQPLDADLALDYLTGALSHSAARAFEATVRGDPRSFAALIEFKDAVFGRATTQVSTVDVPLPPMQRIELGVLSVQVVGRTTLLQWSDGTLRDADVVSQSFALTSEFVPAFLRRYRDPLDELAGFLEKISGQQRELMHRIEELRARMLMARKSGSLKEFELLQMEVAQLQELSQLLSSDLRDFREAIGTNLQRMAAELLDSNDWERETRVDVDDSHLRFRVDPDVPGAVYVRFVSPDENRSECTWVRPDKDFRVLDPTRGRHHALGVIESESFLLIDSVSRGDQPTYVLRIRRLEDVRA